MKKEQKLTKSRLTQIVKEELLIEKIRKITEEEFLKETIRKMIEEDFAGAFPEHMRKKFDGKRRKQAEVLGYTLTGTDDIKVEIDDATIKEGFNKRHFLNLIKQELESKKGQLAYAHDKIRYHMTPKWERKEWLAVAKDLKKDIKNLQIRVKKVSKMKEGKLKEGKTLWELTEEYVNE